MRITWVDTLRAIGIVLVVIGHARLPDAAVSAIFAFHMPLFFFLSGLLLAPKHLDVPFAPYAAKRALALLVPYAVFWGVSVAFEMARDVVADARFLDVGAAIVGLLHGTGEALFVNVVLWFFPSLFVTHLAYYGLHHGLRARTLPWALAALALLGLAVPHLLPMRLPWSVDLVPVSVAFYGLGVLARGHAVLRPFGRGADAAAALALLVGSVALSRANVLVDLNTLVYGSGPLFYAAAVLGIAGTIKLAQALPASAVATFVSANTIVFFPLHLLTFTAFEDLGRKIFGWPDAYGAGTVLGAVAFTVASFLVLTPVAWFLNRWAPWAVGRLARRPTAAVAPITTETR